MVTVLEDCWKNHTHRISHTRPKNVKMEITYDDENALRGHWKGSLRDMQVWWEGKQCRPGWSTICL